MEVVDRGFDLKRFFPFNCGEKGVSAEAMKLGRVVKYASGETLLQSGAAARHCGLILEGQAVAFKTDQSGRRYQLCLDEGCFIGLETLEENRTYTAKINALTELVVLFWNEEGLCELMEKYKSFDNGLRLLDEGRIYQEEWLVPETDITDPVLASQPTHWLSVGVPVFIIIPLLMIGLGACGMLIRTYTAAWLLVFMLLAAAGTLLYRTLTSRAGERTVVTSRNLILVPRGSDDDMTVIRIREIQSLRVKQNLFQKLFSGGRILVQDIDREVKTPLLHDPALTASLLKGFSELAETGKTVPVTSGREPAWTIPLKETAPETPAEPEKESFENLLPPFTPTEFHAHWMLLVRNILIPLIIFIAALMTALHFIPVSKVLLIAAFIAFLVILARIDEWRGNRFRVEEDCVKDFSRKPLSKETLNIAMIPKIESVRFNKNGFFQILFNYGTVYILAGESELDFDYVSDPQHVQKVILDACTRADTKRKLEEEAVRRAYVSDLVTELRGENSSFCNGLKFPPADNF